MNILVKNGRDGYVEADEAMRCGYDFDGYNLYYGGVRYTPFEVIELDPKDLPTDEAGEPILEGVLCSETGRFYKKA